MNITKFRADAGRDSAQTREFTSSSGSRRSRLRGCALVLCVIGVWLGGRPTQAQAAPKSERAIIAMRGTDDGSRLLGTWSVTGSTAKFWISKSADGVAIEGWDSGDGELFQFSGFAWDGTRLTGESVMPSTKHTTRQSLTLVKPNELSGPYAGDTAEGTEVWTRDATVTKPPKVRSERALIAMLGTDDGSRLLGTWSVTGSTAKFWISRSSDGVAIEGWDDRDGERFQFSRMAWDGARFTGECVMPSTKHTTRQSLALVSANELSGPYSGDTAEGTEVWTRDATVTKAPPARRERWIIAMLGSDDGARLLGTWSVRGSSAKFWISKDPKGVAIEGWDSGDGERFEFSRVAWDGKKLTGESIMPSTKHTTRQSLTLVGADELSGPYGGDTATGTEVWTRDAMETKPPPR